MRSKILLLVVAVLLMTLVPGPSQSQTTPPAAYPSATNVNYVRAWIAKAPEQSPTNLVLRPLMDVKQITHYFDGMGRPQEAVTKQGSLVTNPASPGSSSGAVDLVSASVYDAFGRETYTYLPFASSSVQGTDVINDGNFKLSPFQEQISFFNSQLSGQTGETNVGSSSLNWAYCKKNFDSSPLNRVLSTFAPGVNWVGSEATTTPHPVTKGFFVNTAIDNVQIWNISLSQGSIPTSGGISYPEGALYKTITTNEQGNQTIEYTNQDNQLVLKKVQLTAAADNGTGSVHLNWLCTYYVYDDYGNLRFVIPPRVVQSIDGSWGISQTVADELCYRFEYDALNRVEIKKAPGIAEQWTIYDVRNRPVLIQDGNLRVTNQWMFVKYDALDRPVATGLFTDALNTTLAAETQAMTTAALGLNEQRTTSSSVGYSLNQSYPVATSANLLTIVYYDDYGWTTAYGSQLQSKNNSFDGQFAAANNSTFPYPQAVTQATSARGRITGLWSKVLGSYPSSITGIVKANYYDKQGRVVQVQEMNITGGTDVLTVQYNWAGQPLTQIMYNQKNGTNPQNYTLISQLVYDPEGRLLTNTKSVTGTVGGQAVTAPAQVIVSNQYDALGNIKNKALGSLETLTYDYNVREWPLGFNRSYISGTSQTNYFGLDLGYDKAASSGGTTTYVTQEYNGNLAGTAWKSAGDGMARKYDFTYDNSNRLNAAAFLQNTKGAVWDKNLLDFSVSGITYDANGNILTMNQNGYLIGSSGPIDNLAYYYMNSNSSNRLQQVIDGVNNPSSTLGDLHYTGTKTTSSPADYNYDADGNLSYDNNKGITPITYNYLDLPQLIPVANKGSISYVYDASGNKLGKIIVDNATGLTTTTTYVSQFVYQSQMHNPTIAGDVTDVLQYIAHEQGRIRPITPSTFNGSKFFAFDYYIKDHLGNTRVVLTDEKQQDLNVPAATFEDGVAGTLTQYYSVANNANITPNASIPGGYTTNVAAYPNNNGIPNMDTDPAVNVTNSSVSKYMYKLPAGSAQPTDLGITIKVSSGDVVSLYGKSYYFTNGVSSNNNNLITNAINGFVNAFTGTGNIVSGFGHGATTALETSTNALNTALQSALQGMPTAPGTAPRAGINWILFDNQLNAVASNSSSMQVGTVASGVLGSLMESVNISKSGYLYVYCSNESSNIDVYFDNLQVVNNRRPIMEETHYYPFGLTIAALSSRAQNKPENKFKFNNASEFQHQEFSDGSGLELYDATYRLYDPQIGRFNSIDPMAVKNSDISPYAFVSNNPLIYSDRMGLDESTPGFDQDYGTDDGTVADENTDVAAADANTIAGTTDPPNKKGGLVYDPKTGALKSDPNVKSQSDLPPASGLIFWGNHVTLTLADGTTTWFESAGDQVRQLTSDPHWGDLQYDEVDGKIPEKSGTFESISESVVQGVQLTADINSTTWTAMSKIAGAAKEIGEIADKGTIAGIAIGVVDAGSKILSGKGTWKDGVTLGVAAISGIAMATGVGEVAVGLAAIGWDIYNAVSN